MSCDYNRPRQCCQCEATMIGSGAVVGSMMNPDSGIVHWVRRAFAYELDVNWVSLCGLWWVHPWAERRTELSPLGVSA